MGVWKITYVAGSSAAPFSCNSPRLGREPLTVPRVFFRADGVRLKGSLGRDGPAGVALAVGVNTVTFVAVAVGEASVMAVGVFDGGTDVAVLVG